MRVLVIGGGVAGLTAAYKLAGSGVKVLVLEKNDYVGGRIKSGFSHGQTWDGGAQFIGKMYYHTCRLLKETGLLGSLSPIKSGVDIVGPVSSYPLYRYTPAGLWPRFNSLSWSKKLAVLKLALFLCTHRKKLDLSGLAAGVDLDDTSFGEWADNFLCPELTRQYLNPVISSLFFQGAADISRLVPLTLISSPHRCRLYSLSGGLSRLPEILAQRISVMKNCRVLQIRVNPLYHSVSALVIMPDGRQETLTANRVVLAVPPDEVVSLLQEPDLVLGPNSLNFLKDSRFVGVGVTCLVLSSALDSGKYGYVFHPGAHGLTSISFGQGKPRPDSGHETVTIISAGRKQNPDDTTGNDADTGSPDLLLAAEQYLPGLQQKTVHRRDYYWNYAVPCFPPGRVKEIVKFYQGLNPTCPLAFCGDYLGGPGLEGAVASALTAADSIIR